MIIINIFNKMLRKLGIQADAAANGLEVLEALERQIETINK